MKFVRITVLRVYPVAGSCFRPFFFLFFVFFLSLFFSTCSSRPSEPEVVIYTSVDQVFSEPIFKAFEEKTGVRVRAVYDVEASKTTGLVNRLMAEKDRPQADVFWSGEFAQTLLLKEKGVLSPYTAPNSRAIPADYRDPEAYWTGFAARARVLIVNTNLVQGRDLPKSIFDLLSTQWPADKIGLANPVFGTTATQAAALYSAWGGAKAKSFFEEVYKRGVRIVDGNSVVRDLVANGQLLFGLTDTDDAYGAKQKGLPVAIVFPDQGDQALGTLVIPNTVALIAKAPHATEARALIDFLLSPETEQQLIDSGWCHIPLHPGLRPAGAEALSVKAMAVDLADVYKQLEFSRKELTQVFIR